MIFNRHSLEHLMTAGVIVTAAMAVALATSISTDAHAGDPVASVDFVDNQAESVGHATLTQGPHGVLVNVEFKGLAPGPKAIHIHQNGTCDDHAAGFKASGGHVNPDEKAHGLMNPDGPGAGDFPNFQVHENGHAWAEFFNTRVSLDGSTGVNLLDEDGAALVVHEKPDDHKTQPIGGAGARIACGVIEKAKE